MIKYFTFFLHTFINSIQPQNIWCMYKKLWLEIICDCLAPCLSLSHSFSLSLSLSGKVSFFFLYFKRVLKVISLASFHQTNNTLVRGFTCTRLSLSLPQFFRVNPSIFVILLLLLFSSSFLLLVF